MLIAFSGVDGSGKSTQIAKLVEHFERNGESVCIRWFRPGYSPRAERLRSLLRRSGSLPEAGHSPERDKAMARPAVQGAWVLVAAADALVEYAVTLRLLRLRNDVVICDRFVPDSLLDFETNFPAHRRARTVLAGAVRLIGARPDRHVILRLPFEVAQKRRETKTDEPFPDPPEVARQRHDAVAGFPTGRNTVILDADLTPAELHADIVDRLGP